MTPPPAKIKAFLGGLKEDYLEPAGLSYDHLFEGLVQAELVLRGILVQDQAKLWQQVQTSIGKTLLGDSNTKLPRPLVAGANLLAGRLAEALAQAPPTGIPNLELSFRFRALSFSALTTERVQVLPCHC